MDRRVIGHENIRGDADKRVLVFLDEFGVDVGRFACEHCAGEPESGDGGPMWTGEFAKTVPCCEGVNKGIQGVKTDTYEEIVGQGKVLHFVGSKVLNGTK